MTIDQFGRVGDVWKALLGVWLICVVAFGVADLILLKAYYRMNADLPIYKDYTDPKTGCQLQAVYRDGRLTGFNPVWAEDNTIAGCKTPPIDERPEP